MLKKQVMKPLKIAVGRAIVTSITNITANAAENPFKISELSSGYMVAHSDDRSCSEGKCGVADDGGCMFNKDGEFRCGSAKHEERSTGKFSQGKCGAKKESDGKCGANK